MELMAARPPFVAFETVAVEDRQKTLESGMYATRDEDYAYITPAGSKDRIVRVVGEWFSYLKEQVQQERFPAEWLSHYTKQYQAWKTNQEIPEDGTPVKGWPLLSPSQVTLLLSANLRTVESLATANEEALTHLGMGGRALKDQAIRWLESADSGKKQVADLQAQNADMQSQLTAMRELVEKMQAEAEANKKAAAQAANAGAIKEATAAVNEAKAKTTPL